MNGITRVASGVAACMVAWPLWGIASSGLAGPRPALVPNASFEQGTGEAPVQWARTGAGAWRKEGLAGSRCIASTGTGRDNTYWLSQPLGLQPGGLYHLRFYARQVTGGGGTPVTGPSFCNVDLGKIPATWRAYEYCFRAPSKLSPDQARLRFGQWHMKGTVAFDAVELRPAQAVYRRLGELVPGDGEAVDGTTYTFHARLGGMGRNASRPLVRHQCGFNSMRWVFGPSSEVVYRHVLPGRKHKTATVSVSVGYYTRGELAVEVSTDGESWRGVGKLRGLGERSFNVPAGMLPAEAVWVRLRSVGVASLQVYGYRFQSELDGPVGRLRGDTRYVTVAEADANLSVRIEDLGEALPGGRNVLAATVENTSDQPRRVAPSLTVVSSGGRVSSEVGEMVLRPGRTPLRMRYTIPGVGAQKLVLSLGGSSPAKVEAGFLVPELHDASYGTCLPDSSPKVGLWWCPSGWKVSRARPVPQAKDQAMLIRAARNEAEAAQVVLRPKHTLKGLTVRPSPLRGSKGGEIAADRVELLRVRYVPVTQPTDATGCAADWPDPLPPLSGPIDVEAGRNQPLWVRVKVPRDAKAGIYEGVLDLAAGGYRAKVPLRVEVYDFVLPDRMTCTTAFGFSPSLAWRYQNVRRPEDRRAVLAKYLRNMADHHISPYDPAPMDHFAVRWDRGGDWTGGRSDASTAHGGKRSRKVEDKSKTSQPALRYERAIPIPGGGVRLQLWHKAAKGHTFLVSLNHHDANGRWMSGCNRDIRVTGAGEWARLDQTITGFPRGAKTFRLTLWACLYRDDGATTGTVWYDDVSLTSVAGGKALVAGGDFETPPTPPKPTFDFSAWDRAMAKAIDEYHFNSFRLPIQGMGGGTFHARTDPSLLGYTEDTPEYKAAFAAYCRTLQEHLRAKGWLDEAFVYWFDEPAPRDYEFVMNGFRKLKAAAPDLRRMLTEQVEPALVGGPNVWCPVSPHFDPAAAGKRMAAGEAFWWYVCCGPKAPFCTLFIDHPATELRVWLWQTWQRKIEGILVWQTNYWTSTAAYPDPKHPQNPYADPMGWVSGYSTPKGTRRAWGNGDGRFLYPPESAANGKPDKPVLDGPVDSIRWEMLRDGIEDYEYLAILKRLLDAKGESLGVRDRVRARSLLRVPAEITSDMTTFTRDPGPIDQRRHQIARTIEKLRKE